MNSLKNDELRQAIRQHYGRVAEQSGAGCGPTCCQAPSGAEALSQRLGYAPDEINVVPEGANLGLGCGNPLALAMLRAGEVVLDLGSGGGFDCFLAARQVGERGRVIGVDMTPQMVSKARTNAEKGGYPNVEFRLGEIENLPVADGVVDVILSNCVINLSPDKARVFAEAYRVLKPGGRLAIADVVAFAELPQQARQDLALYTGCVAGAATVVEVQRMLLESGFAEVGVTPLEESRSSMQDWVPGTDITEYVVSASIQAIKPAI